LQYKIIKKKLKRATERVKKAKKRLNRAFGKSAFFVNFAMLKSNKTTNKSTIKARNYGKDY
jgi:3-methyladenine DNA glycosylase AlkD